MFLFVPRYLVKLVCFCSSKNIAHRFRRVLWCGLQALLSAIPIHSFSLETAFEIGNEIRRTHYRLWRFWWHGGEGIDATRI